MLTTDKDNTGHEVGALLFELMEPGTTNLVRENKRLSLDSNWGETIRAFLAATQTESGSELLQVSSISDFRTYTKNSIAQIP